MVVNFASVHWKQILGAALAAFVASMLLTMLVVTAYAFMLGFEARGAPDPRRITAFAREVGPTWGPILLWIFTVCAAMWVGRRSRLQPVQHGVLVGAIAATAGLGASWPLDARDAVVFVVVIGAGGIGGFIGRHARSAALASSCGNDTA